MLLPIRATNGCLRLPVRALLGDQLLGLKEQILEFDRMIMAWHRSNQTSKRLHCILGVGPMLATALVASVADPRTFRSGRNFSAWIGLVPKQHSSGGKDRLGSISKQGDRYLRSLRPRARRAANGSIGSLQRLNSKAQGSTPSSLRRVAIG